jgi:LuxR family maltose regulon positive regulatory protein
MLGPMTEVSAATRPLPAEPAGPGPVALIDVAAARRRRPPHLRKRTLRRDRLLRRLAQSADVPLILVVAPAGYGKTTLLSHWVGADQRSVGWLTVDEADDDPSRLVTSIALALDHAGTGLRSVPTGRAGTMLGELARSLETREHPFVLVLDDVHRLRSPEALTALEAVIGAVPPGSQVVLASREEPALPIGRLRAQGMLVDLRPRDLVMTRREAALVLELAGLDLPAQDVLVLLQRTEGWPAGLYLAALSLRDRQDVHGAVARFGGDDRLMADYVREELLGALEADQLTFLQRTSVLDTLSGPLCDAVLESRGSGVVLRDLSRANVLVVPLDDTDATYRHHPLLARMLQAELRRAEPEREADLHRRASAFYVGAGDVDRAIGHAIEAGDAASAGRLLWTFAAGHVLGGRNAEVRAWLAHFTPDQVAAHPMLALAAAASHLALGDRDRVEHWTSAAERRVGGPDAELLGAGVALMRAAVARDGLDQMVADAARAYELSAEDSPWRSLCCLLHGVAAHLRGDPGAGRAHLEEGARRGAIAAPSIQVLCLAQLALIALDGGDWEQAQLLASRARAQAEWSGLDGYPARSLVYAVSALVRAHRDRVEDAQADRRQATELLAALVDYVPWFEVETRVVLARAALRLGDVTGTRALLGEASRLLPRVGDAVVLRASIDELAAQAKAFTVTELVGPSSLTTAELRVLGLMPTHLSFREMGRRLHVSANTIKTHAHAVYRKLDVGSRSEAVVPARRMGLLDVEA